MIEANTWFTEESESIEIRKKELIEAHNIEITKM